MDYKKLLEDQANGNIDSQMIIMFDNDGGHWSSTHEEEDHEQKCEEYTNKYGEPKGYNDLVNVMRAAGFNAEWVLKAT